MRKDGLDALGIVTLTGFSLLLGVNQVVIKLTNGGLQPVFAAGARSAIGIGLILAWMAWRRMRPELGRRHLKAGLLIGALFALEFVCLFLALDITTVARVSVIFYSMPVWLALAAHFVLPGEAMHWKKALGLGLAITGVAWALGAAVADGAGGITGDLLALVSALCWAAIALVARLSTLRELKPESQLLWQLLVSVPLLLLAALAFGPFLREPTLWHWVGLGFQAGAVVSAGFLLWFWLLSIYPAGAVASFSFLTPIFGVTFGWLILGETLGPAILGALVLVCLGLILINRR